MSLAALKDLDVGDWLYGLWGAFVGGGASAVTSGIVVSLKDPTHYAPGSWDFFELVAWVFIVSGMMSAMLFLKQKPAPDRVVTTTTATAVSHPTPSTVLVETTEQIKTEVAKKDS